MVVSEIIIKMKAYTQNKIAISTRLASLKKRALLILMRCLAASTIVYAPIGISAQLEEGMVTGQKKTDRHQDAPLADDSWELAAIGKNRTDEKVSVNSLGSAIASNFPLTYVQFITLPRQ